ncbi:YbaB/EbfC family nucleoid-associated protein [Candidatus Cyrtobacter comes]|uniref:Nucleoid-associated protein Cyrtocomes_00321 n=1 Tax=Candidatus Cyrtobacter comes TaxID=675776 RepID=A0ABU5L746_9RICK|nr:YbaB/EbfC family nucleoid-associated protein [Candidatus Cyrtobacter comes]MDZ5761957.1 YbaB/EbfC family nucleoid-associated protein [Candidatus Cyrtobacter comes]
MLEEMLQQAQDVQKKIKQIQEELDDTEVIGEAGAGAVRVTMDAKGLIKSIKIDKESFATEKIEVLEDLIVAAIQDAKKKSDNAFTEKITEIGLPPDLLKNMFQ